MSEERNDELADLAYADSDYTPRKRKPAKCVKCGDDLILSHHCLPKKITSVEQLDALPVGSVVLTASPRLIPDMCIWIRSESDADGHWWEYRGDDSFIAKDVLYKQPEIAVLIWHPDWLT